MKYFKILILLFVVLFAKYSFATELGVAYISSTGVISTSTIANSYPLTWTSSCFGSFNKGTFPAWTQFIGSFSQSTCTSYPNSFFSWQSDISGWGNLYGDGNYWLRYTVGTYDYYYNFVRSSGVWTSGISYLNTGTSTQITLTSPFNQSLYSNPVTVFGNYTNGGTYDSILWNIQNLTVGQTLDISTSTVVNSNGYFQLSRSFVLPYNGFYTVRATLYDSSTGSSTLSNVLSFSLNSTSTPVDIGLTSSSTDLLSFLNVPELLKTKKPFAYIFQIFASFSSAIGGTATTSLPTGIISIKLAPTVATTTIDMFSSSTIKYFMTSTYINLFRSLEVAFLYFGLGWFLYHDAKRRKLF